MQQSTFFIWFGFLGLVSLLMLAAIGANFAPRDLTNTELGIGIFVALSFLGITCFGMAKQ